MQKLGRVINIAYKNVSENEVKCRFFEYKGKKLIVSWSSKIYEKKFKECGSATSSIIFDKTVKEQVQKEKYCHLQIIYESEFGHIFNSD